MCFRDAVGHVSGAHFNPAVTLAFSAQRHFPKRQIIPYIVAQCLGSITASLIHLITLTPVLAVTVPGAVLDLGVTQPAGGAFVTAFIWEFLLTFILMFVIMGVATDYRAVLQDHDAARDGDELRIAVEVYRPVLGAQLL